MGDNIPVKRGHFVNLTSAINRMFALLPRFCIRFIYSVTRNINGKIGLGLRYVTLKQLMKHCGSNVAIFPNVIIKHPEQLEIGDNVSIHPFCYIDALGGIRIANDVSIAHNCSIISFNHTWIDMQTPIKYNEIEKNPISISNDVWLGCGVRVIGPCNIESRTVIAAGAVAKGNLSGGALYGGVPAKIIKTITPPPDN